MKIFELKVLIAILATITAISVFGDHVNHPRCQTQHGPDVDWSGCPKASVNLTGADLSRSIFVGTLFKEAKLNNTILHNVWLSVTHR